MKIRLPIALFVAMAFTCAGALPVIAEVLEANNLQRSRDAETNPTEASTEPVGSLELSVAAIEKVKSDAAEEVQLDEETLSQINELCDKALASLKEAEAMAAKTAALQEELNQATNAAEEAEETSTATATEAVSVDNLNPDEVRALLSATDQEVGAARERMKSISAEIERRAERRKALPEALAHCREQLAKVQETLKQPLDGDASLLVEARRFYHLARNEALNKELLLINQQSRTFEATSRLWLARRDEADKQLATATEKLNRVTGLAAKAQQEEAAQQAREARMAAANAHPAVKEAAADSAKLAEKNQAVVYRTQQVQIRLAEAHELERTMKQRLQDVTKRAAAAKNMPAIGAMLRSQQDQLPGLGPYRLRLRNRPVETSQLSLDIYEWELSRSEVLHVDKAVEMALLKMEAAHEESMHEYVEAELRRVLDDKADILAELISNANDYMAHLEELETAEKGVVESTEALAAFIAEQVFWVRSAPTFSVAELQYTQSFTTNIDGRRNQVASLAELLKNDFYEHPARWGLATILFVLLLAGFRKARSILKSRGEVAAKPTATLFRPTVEATLATAFLALPAPILVGFVGWRLYQSPSSLGYATGWALLLYAGVYAMLNVVRLASRRDGLCACHFGWDAKGLTEVGRTTRWLQFLVLPPLALAVGVEIAHDQATVNAIGRISLITSLLILSGVSIRLFRQKGPLAIALAASAKNSWSARAVRILAPLVTITALGLIVGSAIGYHYTSVQLTRRIFVTCVFVFACLALRSLLMRWLLVSYRRAAMHRAREKRQAMLEAQENTAAENPVVEVEEHVSLSNINQQAKKLVAVGAALAFVASMWFVWSDVLPALGIFSRVGLWTSGLVSSDPDAGPVMITLLDVFWTGAIFALTVFAARNLPGLLEIAILQRLPLDAGARYAASSITCYLIMVVGVALGMRQIGIGWHSVQWLVAAMTVGLGFGLQEIFANFVSGIILLFERPARVGDTVTIGSITGTVTKIRIRATTILDWDNKELIVPNREFVTGNLVNWTLSNANLRLVIKVGVAYGSDTRLATELLYQVAEESPHVLAEPEPVVVFNEFGDSSLNFELRLFVSDLTMYRRLRHELHMAIDDAFKKHGIEIAFPQCDLHVRTMPQAMQKSLSLPGPSEVPQRREEAA